jgi:hypothetical protein
VFVAFVVAFVAGIIVGSLVPLVIIYIEHGGRFEDGAALMQAYMASILRPTVLLSSGAATQLMLLVTALSAAILSPTPLLKRLRLNRSTLSPLGYVIAPIGALSISFLFSTVVTLLKIPESGTLKMMGDAFKHMSTTQLIFAVLIVGIMPGFAEEFLFRGYAQTRLIKRLGRWRGILITALMFGIMHMDPLQSPFAFAFGLYLGYLAEKCGSIRPTMLCHAANNTIQVFLGWYFGSDTNVPAPRGELGGTIIVAAASLAVVVACCLYIKYRVHSPDDPSPAGGTFPVVQVTPPPTVVG